MVLGYGFGPNVINIIIHILKTSASIPERAIIGLNC